MVGSKKRFVCSACGKELPRWSGRCSGCGEWNTVEEAPPLLRSRPRAPRGSEPVSVASVGRDVRRRLTTGMEELDRVLGGGLVQGSTVLLAGEPGIGKSTLLLQLCGLLAGKGKKILYVSCEESVEQTRLRAERIGAVKEPLHILAESDVDYVASQIEACGPELGVVDSIQMVEAPDLARAPGSVAQVKECALRLVRGAKSGGPPLFLVGHVTKAGAIAGPKVLEHMVDGVLYLEGDRFHAFRVLRSAKNRYGPTNEVGVFEMTSSGLVQVPDPSSFFMSFRDGTETGSCVLPALEGSRVILVEVEALTSPGYPGSARRRVTGLDVNRVSMIVAVLERRAGLRLSGEDVFASVSGGVQVDEPASDIAAGLAIASSVTGRPVPKELVACAEVGLSGRLRGVGQLSSRLKEARKLGFRKAVVADGSRAEVPVGMELIRASHITEALRALG